MKTYKKIILIVLSAIIIILGVIYVYNTYLAERSMGLLPPSSLSDDFPKNNYDVVLKDAVLPQDANIYLKDLDTGSEVWFNTISNVYKENYYNAKFVNGSLYIIKRFENGNDFTDELWKYDKEKSREDAGVKLFSGKGFDFRILNNGNIAIETRTNDNTSTVIKIINKNGLSIKEFSWKDLSIDSSNKDISISFLYENSIHDNYIILQNTIIYGVIGLTKIDAVSGEIIKYNFDKIDKKFAIASNKFYINPSLTKIVFIDAQFNFDIDSEIDYLKHEKNEKVIAYDLNSKEQKTVMIKPIKDRISSIKWIDDETIEYKEHTITSDLNDLGSEEKMNAFIKELEIEGETKTLKINF